MPRRLPRPISREHLEDLLNKSGVHLRARVMIHLAAYEGLRVHEIAAPEAAWFENWNEPAKNELPTGKA